MEEIREPIEQWDEREDRLREEIEATLKPEDKLLLVLSDSHGDLSSVVDIITRWEKHISAVLFLGDGAEELLEAAYIFPDLPFYPSAGNGFPAGVGLRENSQRRDQCGRHRVLRG